MKYVIILGDGMSDRPLESLGGQTPLMVAHKPHIDLLCAGGRCGLFVTVPPGMPPGSAVANLAVLGYDPAKTFRGRGVLEAASMGVELEPTDIAMRCNLISVENGRIKNHSAGHITTPEARELIEFLDRELGTETVHFHPGISYRHLLVLNEGSEDIECTPPHDVPGQEFEPLMIRPLQEEALETVDLLNGLIRRSQKMLRDHPVNLSRIAEGKDPANSAWFWSPGRRPMMKTLNELYGITGAVISAVDLVKGLGVYAGLEVIEVEGATGLYDTNYEGKAEAALKALEDHDLVYVHVEASDEAGHEGDVDLKVRTIEYLDSRLVRHIVEGTSNMSEDVAIAVTPDHGTPCSVRTHVHDPVPFLVYRPGEEPDDVTLYDEESVKKGSLGTIRGDSFIRTLLGLT
jgi:2,3-bisphosphoglycerate-independent phosphoglycerate mutase